MSDLTNKITLMRMKLDILALKAANSGYDWAHTDATTRQELEEMLVNINMELNPPEHPQDKAIRIMTEEAIKEQERAIWQEGYDNAVRECLSQCNEGNKNPNDKLHDEVRKIGEQFGYGALMYVAAYEWRDSLVKKGYPPGGEFSIGPCVGTVKTLLKKLETKNVKI